MAYLITVELYWDDNRWRTHSRELPKMNISAQSLDTLMRAVRRAAGEVYGGEEGELRIIMPFSGLVERRPDEDQMYAMMEG